MSRSAKKGPFVNEKLYKKVAKLNENRAKQPLKTWARACTIIPEFVGHTFEVHNGNKFLKVFVQEDMVGHKLGEFSPTRIFRGHSGKKAAEAAAAAAGGGAPAPAKGYFSPLACGLHPACRSMHAAEARTPTQRLICHSKQNTDSH